MEHLAVIVSVCSGLLCITNAISLILLIFKGLKNIKEGLKCMLRNEILKKYYRYEKDAEMPQYVRENLDSLFAAYVSLGGNSFVIDIYNDMRDWDIVSHQ